MIRNIVFNYRVAGLCSVLLLLLCAFYFLPKRNTVYIGVIGPMSGPSKESGEEMKRGVELCLDHFKNKSGFYGRKVEPIFLDDQDDPKLAAQKANELAERKDVLLVLGHNLSSTSIAAGDVYQRVGLPAITASATADEITAENQWYFRTVFSNSFQAQLLATYISKVLHHQQVMVIADIGDAWGRAINQHFESACDDLNLKIQHRWEFNSGQNDVSEQIDDIINELKSEYDSGIVFIAAQAIEGADIVSSLRYNNEKYTIVGADTFSTKEFVTQLTKDPVERIEPGYYSDGIYTISPLNTEITGKESEEFKYNYKEAFHVDPSWLAAGYYEAAKLAIAAIEQADIDDDSEAMFADNRIKVRDKIASLLSNSINSTGGGNGINFVTVSKYKNHHLVPASQQLQNLPVNIKNNNNLAEDIVNERIFKLGKMYFSNIDLVYTGITINKISDIDIKKEKAFIDFYLWFRYGKNFPIENIEFSNALKKIQFATHWPEKKEKSVDEKNDEKNEKVIMLHHAVLAENFVDNTGMTSRLYRVKGEFKIDFLPEFKESWTHTVGVTFQHEFLPKRNLIYVTDTEGMMPTNDKEIKDYLKDNNVLSSISGWTISDTLFFQDSTIKDLPKNIAYFDQQNKNIYSRFNAFVKIKQDELTFRGAIVSIALIPKISNSALLVAIICGPLFLFILYLSKKGHVCLFRGIWFLQFLLGITSLLSVQIMMIHFMNNKLEKMYIDTIMIFFDIIWWIFFAMLLILATEYFLWHPVEIATKRVVPRVIRVISGLTILLLTSFGIASFVFNQNITGVLATSGFFAMIVGLAVQMNLSNIFSGIAMNIERPFRIGDWVKIGDCEGKIMNMTWRSTRMLTRDDTIVSIPNNMASDSLVENFSYPNEIYRITLPLQTAPVVEPEKIKQLLVNAVISVKDILNDPSPSVKFKGQGESSAKFDISFHVEDYEKKVEHISSVWSSIWTHLYYEGVELAKSLSYNFEGNESIWDICNFSEKPHLLIKRMPIFHTLSDDVKNMLINFTTPCYIKKGETIVREGDNVASLFIICKGVVDMIVHSIENDGRVEVNRMGVGSFFGEKSLLAEERISFTVAAATEVLLYELKKSDFMLVIEKYPDTVNLLSDFLMRRESGIHLKKHQTS